MKFKYTGDAPIKDVDLTLAGIFKPSEPIVKGRIFEVPDENKKLIKRVKLSSCYEPYIEPIKKVKGKSQKKKEEKEAVEEEN